MGDVGKAEKGRFLSMVNEASGDNSAEDREAIRLAKARLVRVCRLTGLAAEQALTRAAAEQRAALVAVAMRVLAASPQDLAAGRVLEVGRVIQPRQATGARRQGRTDQRWRGRTPKRPQR
jgi:hypothetical protein